MFKTLLYKELLDAILSLKFVVSFVVVTVVLIFSLNSGATAYLENIDEAKLRQEFNHQFLVNQNDWIAAGVYGVTESRIPYVLNVFDRGITNSLGREAVVNTDMETRLDKSKNLVSPILSLFDDIDLTFIVKVILSLFAILLSYEAISGEKERGTLRLIMTNKVPRYLVIISKIIAGFIVLALSLILPLLIGIAFLAGFHPQILNAFDATTWMRFIFMLLTYVMYLAVFLAIGVFVSALCHRSSTSFVVMLMIWILFVAIIPQLSQSASERFTKYQSYVSLQTQAMKEIAEKRDEWMKEVESSEVWRKAIREGTVPQLMADQIIEETRLKQEVMDQYSRRHDQQQSRQILLAKTMARTISPVSAMSFAVQDLAGSGWSRQQEYLNQLREFQKGFRAYIVDELDSLTSEDPRKIWDVIYDNESLDVKKQAVTFDFIEEPLDAVVSNSLWDIGVLGVLFLVFFSAAFVAFLRYDVR